MSVSIYLSKSVSVYLSAIDLDDASIRRFNFKVGFNYLTDDGKIALYKKLIEPILESPLDEYFESHLKSITNLAPGDFKVVKNKFQFSPKDKLTHQVFIQALQEESKVKERHKGKKAIGF